MATNTYAVKLLTGKWETASESLRIYSSAYSYIDGSFSFATKALEKRADSRSITVADGLVLRDFTPSYGHVLFVSSARRQYNRAYCSASIAIRLREEGSRYLIAATAPPHFPCASSRTVLAFSGRGDLLTADELSEIRRTEISRSEADRNKFLLGSIRQCLDRSEVEAAFVVTELDEQISEKPSYETIDIGVGKPITVRRINRPSRKFGLGDA